jgi:hypothetical protein
MIERTWHYYRDTLQEGPISESALRSLMANGKLPNDVLVYCGEISQEWMVASDLEVFQNLESLRVQQENVPKPVELRKTQRFDQPKKTQRIAQPSSNTPPSVGRRQTLRRLAQPQMQYSSSPAPTVRQSSTSVVQKTVQKKDDDSSLGCGFLIAMASFIPHLQFLLIFAGIFVCIGCCKHLFKGEFKKTWDALLGFLILYGFCFVVSKIIGKVYSVFFG